MKRDEINTVPLKLVRVLDQEKFYLEAYQKELTTEKPSVKKLKTYYDQIQAFKKRANEIELDLYSKHIKYITL